MKTISQQTKGRLEAQLRWWKNYNAFVLFIFFPVSAIYGIWTGDWRAFWTGIPLLAIGAVGVVVWDGAIKGEGLKDG